MSAEASAVFTGATSRRDMSTRDALATFDRIRAVLFDLDGTLYQQRPMRVLVAVELLAVSCIRPVGAARRWRALAAYRRAQETLRASDDRHEPEAQVRIASARTGLPPAQIEQTVGEWMLRRPLKYIRLCRSRGLLSLLDLLATRGIAAGVLSDYPVEAKLAALGLNGRFSLVLCSTDSTVGALKPHPRSFLVACERWRLQPSDVLVVGDRPDVDAAGAAAAGMPCIIVGRPRSRSDAASYLTVPSLTSLSHVLTSRH